MSSCEELLKATQLWYGGAATHSNFFRKLGGFPADSASKRIKHADIERGLQIPRELSDVWFHTMKYTYLMDSIYYRTELCGSTPPPQANAPHPLCGGGGGGGGW